MAKFNPSTSFPFDKPTEWPDWKQHFDLTKLNKFVKRERYILPTPEETMWGNGILLA